MLCNYPENLKGVVFQDFQWWPQKGQKPCLKNGSFGTHDFEICLELAQMQWKIALKALFASCEWFLSETMSNQKLLEIWHKMISKTLIILSLKPSF